MKGGVDDPPQALRRLSGQVHPYFLPRPVGRLAYDQAVLLMIVLYCYHPGIVSSLKLAKACERNVQFMALSADTRPHFTPIADSSYGRRRQHTMLPDTNVAGAAQPGRQAPLEKSS